MLKFQEKYGENQTSSDGLEKKAWNPASFGKAVGKSDDVLRALENADDLRGARKIIQETPGIGTAGVSSAMKTKNALKGADLPEGFVKLFKGGNRALQNAEFGRMRAALVDAAAKYRPKGTPIGDIPHSYWEDAAKPFLKNDADAADVIRALSSGDYAKWTGKVDDAARAGSKADEAARAKAMKGNKKNLLEETARGSGKYTPEEVAEIHRNADKIRKGIDQMDVALKVFVKTGDPKELATAWKALEKIKPAALRGRMRKSLEKGYAFGMEANQRAKQSITIGDNASVGDITQVITQISDKQANFGGRLRGFRNSISKLDGDMKQVQQVLDEVDNKAVSQGLGGAGGHGGAGGRVGDVTQEGATIHVNPTINIGDMTASMRQAAETSGSKALIREAEDIERLVLKIDELKQAGRISEAEHLRVIQKLQDIGNTHLKLAVNVGGDAAKAAKGKKWLKWLLGGAAVAGIAYVAYQAGQGDLPWQDKDPDPGPDPCPPGYKMDGGRCVIDEGGGEGQVPPNVEDIVEKARSGNWQESATALAELKALADAGDPKAQANLRIALEQLKRVYRMPFYVEMVPPFTTDDGIDLHYAFVRRVRGGPNPTDPFLVQSVREGLDDLKGGGGVYNVKLVEQGGDGQRALNEAYIATAGYGLAERGWLGGKALGRRRSRRLSQGKGIRNMRGMGYAGRQRQNVGRDVRKRRRRAFRRGVNASHRIEMLTKYAELTGSVYDESRAKRFDSLLKIAEEATYSTNNNTIYDDSGLFKSSDDVSKAYYKDAVTDLNNSDPYLRSYFTGLKGLYDEKAETPKGDYKSLYNVHDETGVDLIHSAHPKAVVVSDSIGRGGLVENGLEQKRQTHGVALSAPTGNYRANYAWVRDALEKRSK
jgi:hypothetical protein